MMVARRVMTGLWLVLLGACGGAADKTPAADSQPAASATPALTPFQVENGIGPVTTAIEAGPIDKAMAETGEKLFEERCALCHKLDERYVGPALGGVTTRRTPTYVMNMILNPEGMYTNHPVARGLLAEYATQMPNLGLTQEQARSIVEYFREQDAKGE